MSDGQRSESVDVPEGMKQVGWWVVDDDHFINMSEEAEFGHCYRELRPVFTREAS